MNSDFKELLHDLLDFEVRFLVVGGYAVIHYAEPRYTKDLDLWIEPSQENALRFRSALSKFGAWLEHMSLEDFSQPGTIYQIGLPPTRIDFITSMSDLSFDHCWQHRSEVRLVGRMVPFIGLDDLILSKLAAGRDQDLMDVKALKGLR